MAGEMVIGLVRVNNVTDPRLQRRLADKKEEVFRFLWQHLGLEPGTDLKFLSFLRRSEFPRGHLLRSFWKANQTKVSF